MTQNASRLRLLRFRLRSLLVLVALLAAICGLTYPRQREDVALANRELASLRFHKMEADADGKTVFLDVSEQDGVTDATLAVVRCLPHLKEFHAIYCPIRGDGLAHFVGLKQLETLDLFATRVDDRAMTHISKLKSLKKLNVTPIPTTPAGKPTIGDPDISDKGLGLIAGLPNLETLVIAGKITDDGLQQLVRLKKLRYLEIGSSMVTENGIKRLQAQMPGLEIN